LTSQHCHRNDFKKQLFLLISLLCVLFIGTSCIAPIPKPAFITNYTADQVIKIAQAKYPMAYGIDSKQTPTIISAVYIDTAIWRVDITCPRYYYLERPNSGILTKTLYFYETDSCLYQKYD
jgi:hypothetical protein